MSVAVYSCSTLCLAVNCQHVSLVALHIPCPRICCSTKDCVAAGCVVVAPLVAATLTDGGISTIMCFGQTGSGKTFTTNGVAERAALLLFSSVAASTLPADCTVSAVCVEVAGTKINDLLTADPASGELGLHAALWLLRTPHSDHNGAWAPPRTAVARD